MSHITRLILRVVMNRVRGRTLQEIAPEQYGFMPDKGTRNTIFVLRRMPQRVIEKQKDIYACFIDNSKAFDTVRRSPLINLLKAVHVDSHDAQLLANIYTGNKKQQFVTMVRLVNGCVSSKVYVKDV